MKNKDTILKKYHRIKQIGEGRKIKIRIQIVDQNVLNCYKDIRRKDEEF